MATIDFDPNQPTCPKCQLPLTQVIKVTRFASENLSVISYYCECKSMSHVVVLDDPIPNDPYVVETLWDKPHGKK